MISNKNREKSSYCNLTTFLHKCLCFLSAIVAIDWQSYTFLYVARVLRDTHCKEPLPKRRAKKQFPEKELRGHSSNFHILVSVSDLCIHIESAYSAAGNMWTDPGNI